MLDHPCQLKSSTHSIRVSLLCRRCHRCYHTRGFGNADVLEYRSLFAFAYCSLGIGYIHDHSERAVQVLGTVRILALLEVSKEFNSKSSK